MTTRRGFLESLLTAGAALPALRDDALPRLARIARHVDRRPTDDVTRDEDFWLEVQQAFTLDRTIINLNNGGVSPSPRIVQDAMRRYLEYSNTAPAYTMWQVLEPEIEAVRHRLAASFGCDPEEMAITRNASEALEIVQLGIPLERGDEVLTTTQDYPRMLTTWHQRERREGIVLREIGFPVPPPSQDDLADRFARAITPKTKVIHVCHITNLTGQIFPIRKIVRLARERGIEVIVDGPHAFAHFPYTRDELDCDYSGTSLHKWLLAPHGTGFLYVRKAKIERLWPLMAAPPEMNRDVRKFEEIGTHPAANHNAIAEALTFHEGLGPERKAARLRYLFQRWAKRLDQRPGVRILTPYDPAQSCGLASLSVEGLDVNKLVAFLWDKHRILVTPIVHKEFSCVRVTPIRPTREFGRRTASRREAGRLGQRVRPGRVRPLQPLHRRGDAPADSLCPTLRRSLGGGPGRHAHPARAGRPLQADRRDPGQHAGRGGPHLPLQGHAHLPNAARHAPSHVGGLPGAGPGVRVASHARAVRRHRSVARGGLARGSDPVRFAAGCAGAPGRDSALRRRPRAQLSDAVS